MKKVILTWSLLILLVMITVAAQTKIAVPVPDGLELGCNLPTVGFESGLPPTWSSSATTSLAWGPLANCESGLVPPIQNWTSGSGDAMCANSDAFSFEDYDVRFVSNPFTIPAGVSAASLGYKANYQDLTPDPGRDYLDVDISNDGGSSWNNLKKWNEDHGGFGELPGENVSADLLAYAGQTVIVRWRYYDLNNIAWDWYAQIDEVALTCDSGVDYSDLTPTINGTAWHGDPSPRTLWLGPLVNNDANDLEGTDYATNDGVSFEGDWIAGEATTVVVKVSANDGWIAAWIDWDGSGTFDHPVEKVLDEAVVVGDNTLSIDVPGYLDPQAKIVARFRLYAAAPTPNTIDSLAKPDDGAADGEVEDYIWNRNSTAVNLAQFTGGAASNWYLPILALITVLLLSLPVVIYKVRVNRQ